MDYEAGVEIVGFVRGAGGAGSPGIGKRDRNVDFS
jgi:hypothetical protein